MSQELRAALQLGMPDAGDLDLDVLRKERSENFLLRIMAATGRLQSLADRQEEDDDLRGAVTTYSKIHAWIEMEGRFLGDLNAATLHIRHSFVRSHEWSKLKAVFVRELESHPELSARILAAMRSIQDETETAVPLLEVKPNGHGAFAS